MLAKKMNLHNTLQSQRYTELPLKTYSDVLLKTTLTHIALDIVACKRRLNTNAKQSKKNSGPFRDSDWGTPAPKAGIYLSLL